MCQLCLCHWLVNIWGCLLPAGCCQRASHAGRGPGWPGLLQLALQQHGGFSMSTVGAEHCTPGKKRRLLLASASPVVYASWLPRCSGYHSCAPGSMSDAFACGTLCVMVQYEYGNSVYIFIGYHCYVPLNTASLSPCPPRAAAVMATPAALAKPSPEIKGSPPPGAGKAHGSLPLLCMGA